MYHVKVHHDGDQVHIGAETAPDDVSLRFQMVRFIYRKEF